MDLPFNAEITTLQYKTQIYIFAGLIHSHLNIDYIGNFHVRYDECYAHIMLTIQSNGVPGIVRSKLYNNKIT